MQMTCIRLLETLPIIFERLQSSLHSCLGNQRILVKHEIDFKWLLDLVDWGKSTLAVVVRYWKQTVISLLDFLKSSSGNNSSAMIKAIEILISSGGFTFVYILQPFRFTVCLFFVLRCSYIVIFLKCRKCCNGEVNRASITSVCFIGQ